MAKFTNSQKAPEKMYKLAEHLFTPSKTLANKFEEQPYVQVTTLFGRTYASRDEFSALVDALNLDEYEYIVHDKDTNDDGSTKEPHIHFLLYKAKPFRLTRFTKLSQNTTIEIPRNKTDAEKYLCHENAPSKYQYPRTELVEYHPNGVNTLRQTKQEQRENRNLDLLDDICNLTRRQMAEKYGADYIKNYRRYEDFMQVVTRDEREEECDVMARECSPEDEFYHLSELSGDEIRLTLADYVCLQLREKMDGFRMPTVTELVELYFNVLHQARERRNALARALRCDRNDVEVAEV